VKKRSSEIKKLESENNRLKTDLSQLNETVEILKLEKASLPSKETILNEEMKQWKKTLETTLQDTKEKLESESGTRLVLEKVLLQMKIELEDEVKARSKLENLKFKLEMESQELKKRLAELGQLSESFEEETKARNSWKEQLEGEFQELNNQKSSDVIDAEQTFELLEEIKKELEDESKARIDLENSKKKKLVISEENDLKQLIQEVDHSKKKIRIRSTISSRSRNMEI